MAPSGPSPSRSQDPAHPFAVGLYRLIEVLGEGGMGTVCLAEQTEPVRRQVALKLVRASLDGEEVLARFDAERQVLAWINVDGFDAGTG